jgi:hemerythrin superfamily protein
MGIISRLLGRELSTDVLELLRSQHDEVDALFAALEEGRDNRAALFGQLADTLAAHATIEEKLFYPAVLAKNTEAQLHEAVEEHLAIKRVLADLITMTVDEATFRAKLSVLKEDVSHHARKEEEAKLFPKVKLVMSTDERAALGNECLVMFEDLMASQPRDSVPAEIAAAAPLPTLAATR